MNYCISGSSRNSSQLAGPAITPPLISGSSRNSSQLAGSAITPPLISGSSRSSSQLAGSAITPPHINHNTDKRLRRKREIYNAGHERQQRSRSDCSLKLYATNLTNNPFLNISGTASSRLSGINLQWGEDYGSVHMAIEKLIKSLRASFNDHESKERNTPMRDDLKSDLPDEEACKEKPLLLMQKRYRTLVGTFIFIAQTCRPDIS